MNFKKMREKSGLTQENIASKLKIDRSTVAKWETGEAMPRADKLVRLSKILGCTVDELLKNPVHS